MNTFAERLRYARTLRHMNQTELAKVAGLSQGAISNYEQRFREKSRSILKLAKALQVNPLWLEDGIGPMEQTLPPPSSLNDPGALPGEIHSISWPFSYVMPGTFHSLSADQKQMIEDMILAMAKRNQGSR